MSDVVLINAPILLERTRCAVGDESWCPPLGLMYVASCLRNSGFSVRLLDVRAMDMDPGQVMRCLEEERPGLVGISALTSSIRSAVSMGKMIKDVYGDSIHVCLGGSHVSADPGVIDRFPGFDSAVTREGELAFAGIVKRVLGGEKVAGVVGGETCMDLDSLPFPSRDMVNASDYRENRAFILTSRGCPHKCIFCSLPALSDRVRYRSGENVAEEIAETAGEYGGRAFFVDDTFTLSRKHAIDVCRSIIDRGLKVQWVANTRADGVDEELLSHMKEAGCEEIAFGVESGSERVRTKVIGKRISDEQIAGAVRLCRKAGIRTAFYLMLGFPTETVEDMRMTVACGAKFRPDLIGVHPTVPMPGSELFLTSVREGKVRADITDLYIRGELGEGFRGVWPTYVPDGLTPEGIYRMRRRAYYRFYLRPSFLLRRLWSSVRSWQQLRSDLHALCSLLRHGRTDTSLT